MTRFIWFWTGTCSYLLVYDNIVIHKCLLIGGIWRNATPLKLHIMSFQLNPAKRQTTVGTSALLSKVAPKESPHITVAIRLNANSCSTCHYLTGITMASLRSQNWTSQTLSIEILTKHYYSISAYIPHAYLASFWRNPLLFNQSINLFVTDWNIPCA